jgi:hypothetical protein
MTSILCRSPFLASELAGIIGTDTQTIIPPMQEQFETWFGKHLHDNDVSLVLYEPRFFIDPSPFRIISPRTRFIVLSGPGDEQSTHSALISGACAAIEKPLIPQDVHGVISLVSR